MIPSSRFKLRFFFDAGSGCCFWAANDASRDRYGIPVESRQLPLPENTRRRMEYIVAWYDTCIDWDDPPGPTPWDHGECERFNQAALRLLDLVREQLGPEYEIANEFTPVTRD